MQKKKSLLQTPFSNHPVSQIRRKKREEEEEEAKTLKNVNTPSTSLGLPKPKNMRQNISCSSSHQGEKDISRIPDERVHKTQLRPLSSWAVELAFPEAARKTLCNPPPRPLSSRLSVILFERRKEMRGGGVGEEGNLSLLSPKSKAPEEWTNFEKKPITLSHKGRLSFGELTVFQSLTNWRI